MYIEKLYIRDFGGTKDREYSFKNGINIVEGQNESGKSTLAAFIKFIFYGFSDKAERTRYYTWGTKSASGTVTVVVDSKKYRIEREYIENSGDKTSIIDLDSNTPVFEGHSPEDVFLGVSADVFAHTAYIGQASGGYINGSKVSSSIENILFSADENIDTEKALKRLDAARVLLQHKKGKGGKIYELTCKRDEFIRRLDEAKQKNSAIIEKEGTLRETKASIIQNMEKLEAKKDLLNYYEAAKKYRTYKSYKGLKKKVAELETVIEALKKSYTYEGFFPNQDYIDQIETLSNEAKRLEETANELNRELEHQRNKSQSFFEASAFIEKVNELGGIDEVVHRFKAIKKRKTAFSVCSAIMFVLGILLGVSTYFSLTYIPSVSLYLGAVALVMLILGVVFIIASSRQKINENEFLALLDMDTKEDFNTAVSGFVSNENTLSIFNSRINDLEEKYQSVSAKLREKESALMAQALRFGKHSAQEAVKKAKEVIRLVADNSAEMEKYILARDSLKSQAEGIDPTELKIILDGRPYTEDSFDKKEVEDAQREKDFYTKSTEHLKQKEAELERDLAVLMATAEPPTKLGDSINSLTTEIERLTKKNEAYLLAYEKLSQASNNLRAGITPTLAANAGKLLGIFTNERYTTIGIGKDLEMSYETEGKLHKIDYMSAGTKDLAYYSLRISLISTLFKKQLPPVIFDESFARLDDKRMDNMFGALSELSSNGIQLLVFTSQKRDAERIKLANIDAEHIII
ncbi:MAG: AAA family ATPase [Clostridia bacterium]|nr:AAA family ATPase [Clostridia bacterium]